MTILITGSTDGIGLETAMQLALARREGRHREVFDDCVAVDQ